MKSFPDFEDYALDKAMRDLGRTCTEAKQRGVAITEIEGGVWQEHAMTLEQMHPHLKFAS